MSNYFRITAYHPTYNISAIFDSNGRFEKLWQFSACLVANNFKIIEAHKYPCFESDNLYANADICTNKIMLIACAFGEPVITSTLNHNKLIKSITVNKSSYWIYEKQV